MSISTIEQSVTVQKQTLWSQELLGMSFSSLFQYMSHYALIAALPILVIDQLNGTDWQAGLVMTFFQIGAICCRPLAGSWIDRFDKKKMLLISLGLFVLVSILYVIVSNFYLLLGIRLLHGAIFAVGTTLAATVATLVLPVERKGEGIGYFAMFSNLAMVLGPFFSLSIITHYPANTLFEGGVVLALLSFWAGNPKNLSDSIRKSAKQTKKSSQWTSLIEPKALPMAFLGGLLFFAYAGVLVFSPIYAKHLQLTEYTSLFFAVFALVIVVTRPIVGKLFDRLGANFVVYPGFVLFAIGLVELSRINDALGFLIAGGIIGIGFGALSPVFQTLAVQLSPVQRAGAATATYFLALDISVGIGSFALSVIASNIGYQAMYLFTAVVVAVTTAVYYVLRAKKRTD